MNSEAKRIRVLFVEDHQLLADALSALLAREPDMEVVGIAGTVADAKVMSRERLDVVLMDYHLPDGTGAEATREIKARWPAARVVMVTAISDDETVLESIQAGADGYMTKDRAAEDVVKAVREAHAGEILLPPSVAVARERGDERRMVEPLTARELEVLRALTEGLSTPDICERLFIAPNTLRTHVQNIMGKLRVHSKLEAVAFALRYRLVEPAAARGRPDRPGLSQGRITGPCRPYEPGALRRRPVRRCSARRSPSSAGGPGSSFGFWRRTDDRRSRSRRSEFRKAPQRGQRRSSRKSDSSGATV